ncbi:MAG TPA: hypothetical protein VI357_26350, partial [Mycobacteriales bacterium]
PAAAAAAATPAEQEPAADDEPAPDGPRPLLSALRADPRLRAVLKRVPGARPAVLALRRRRAARAAR